MKNRKLRIKNVVSINIYIKQNVDFLILYDYTLHEYRNEHTILTL